jgi:hypothetical protein
MYARDLIRVGRGNSGGFSNDETSNCKWTMKPSCPLLYCTLSESLRSVGRAANHRGQEVEGHQSSGKI